MVNSVNVFSPEFLKDNVAPLFFYTTPKRIKIRYWQLGVTHYILSIIMASLLLYQLLDSGDYLRREPVQGRANPFATAKMHTPGTDRPYCSSVKNRFIWSDVFAYQLYPGSKEGPACRDMGIYEISLKSIN